MRSGMRRHVDGRSVRRFLCLMSVKEVGVHVFQDDNGYDPNVPLGVIAEFGS
jgi:hypothetical protein